MSSIRRSHTQIFLKFIALLFKLYMVENWWKNITVTDEKIFRVCKAFDRKKITVIRIGRLPTHSFRKKGCQYREEDYENKILS